MTNGPADRLRRRPETPADTDRARAIHHAAFRDVVERQFGEWDEERQDRFFDSDWSGAIFEVLEWHGEACGYAAVEERPDEVHVQHIVVDPRFQNRGIGSAVLEQAIARARERGVPVVLGALHENRAIGLYRRLGFTEIGRGETHTLFRLHP